jgi:hypothetical protein
MSTATSAGVLGRIAEHMAFGDPRVRRFGVHLPRCRLVDEAVAWDEETPFYEALSPNANSPSKARATAGQGAPARSLGGAPRAELDVRLLTDVLIELAMDMHREKMSSQDGEGGDQR